MIQDDGKFSQQSDISKFLREIELLSKEFCLLSLSHVEISLIKPSLLASTAISFALEISKYKINSREFCQIIYYWEIIVSKYLSGKSSLEVRALSEEILQRISFIKQK